MYTMFKPEEFHDEFGKADPVITNTPSVMSELRKVCEIDYDLYDYLVKLGIIRNNVRNYNIGTSNYSSKLIQPWSVWIDWNLNPWDADIIKRIGRKKEIQGMSEIESRIEDYEKIKHICDERIRQLRLQN